MSIGGFAPVSQTEEKPVRPLFVVASYPASGGERVSAAILLMAALAQPNPPRRIDLSNLENIIPLDCHGDLYRKATGKEIADLSEEEVAAARPKVHALLAANPKGFPVMRSHAVRGTFYGHPTFNRAVIAGAIYVVRNPLDIAAALTESTGAQPMKVIEVMMTANRRVRSRPNFVSEPQGSWSQNVVSWTEGSQEQVLVLRFDELGSRAALKKLAEHLKLPVSGKGIETTAGLLGEMESPQGQSQVKRDFRETLQPVHARAVIEAHGVQMDRHAMLSDAVLDYANIDRKTAMALAEKHAPKLG